MNPTYYSLPIDKQKKLVNAGYKLFALYPYKKASMSLIAEEANISKSLLFYYFKNKKEYYLFLFDIAIEFINEKVEESISENKYDMFELLNQTVEKKMKLLKDYPYLYKFVASAYYETFEDLKEELDKKKMTITQNGEEEMLKLADQDRLKNPSEVKVLYKIILSTAEGCMRGCEDLDIEKMQRLIGEFNCMMESLKKHYYKDEYLTN